MQPRNATQRLALDRAAAGRKELRQIIAGVVVAVVIAGVCAWWMGTLSYFVGGNW